MKQENRRKLVSRRLTTRLLLRISLWAVGFVLAVAILHFSISYQEAQRQLLNELVSDIEQRLKVETVPFRNTEQAAEILAEHFLALYRAGNDNPQRINQFNAWHEETSPGVMRSKPELHSGYTSGDRWLQHISTFIGPREAPLTNELKARIVTAEIVLNELAPAWTNFVNNTHISMPENALVQHSKSHPWGLLASPDLVITNYSVVRSTLPEYNPTRKPGWTGLYYDLSAKYWTITYQLPVDYAGKHLINASHDIALDTILPAIIAPLEPAAEHFLFNQSQQLLASAETFSESYQHKGVLAIDLLTNPLYAEIYGHLAEAGFQRNPLILYNAIPEQLLIAQKVPGFDWWHVTLYPYRNIQKQALRTPALVALGTLAILLIILFIVYLMVTRHVSKPLRQLADMALLIGDKEYEKVLSSKLLSEYMRSEVGLLLRSFRSMAGRLLENQQNLEKQVANRTKQLAAANAKLARIAQLDGLTGLLNRRSFDEDFAQAHQHADQKPMALLFCDLDHFKQFNDTYGHQAGDHALIAVSQALEACQLGKVYRYGGEELAVLVPCDAHDPATFAMLQAEQLRTAVAELAITHQHSAAHLLTLSVGVQVIDNNKTIADNLVAADKALYQAKNAGRNRVHLGC